MSALPKHYASSTNISVGDKITYTVELPSNIFATISAPTINGFEKLSEKVDYQSLSTLHQFEFQIFSIKNNRVPTLSLTSINGLEPMELLPIFFTVKSVLPPTMNTLNDIDPVLDLTHINWLILISVAMLLVGLVIGFFIRKNQKKKDKLLALEINNIPPGKIALNQLNDLLKGLMNDPKIIKKAYFECTEIFYRYLTNKSHLNFLDATTVEVHRLLKKNKPFSSTTAKQIIVIAKETDQCKFSNNPTLEFKHLEDIIKQMKIIIKGQEA